MAVSRPVWRGQLRLSLVSINVEMFPATQSNAKPAFHQIHEPTGQRVHYQKVADGVGPVPADEIKKGYEYEKGDYVLLEDDELDAVRLETKKTLDLIQFVDDAEIPALYYDAPYFITPADDLAEDAFRVVRDALRKAKKVGLGQLALRGKEYLVAVKPCGKGILLETLHYENEIRKSDPYFAEIEAKTADPELLEVAEALINKKTSKFDPKAFKDHYQAALRELIERKLKLKGRRITTNDDEGGGRPETNNVIDLMAALKKSLEGSGGAPKREDVEADEDEAPKPVRKPAAKSAPKAAATKKAAPTKSAAAAAAKPAATKAAPRKKAS